MRRVVRCVLVASFVGAAPAAFAADFAALPEPPVLIYPEDPVATSAAFYFRIDIGYALFRNPEVTFELPELGYEVPGAGEFLEEDLGAAGLLGFGVGYDFGWLRTDVTVDRGFRSRFTGERICVGCAFGGDDTASEWATISSLAILANVYVDLGGRDARFSPYVGAGVGAAMLHVTDAGYEEPDGTVGNWGDGRSWSLAWALMAGVAVDVSERLSLDIGYRFVHLGDAEVTTPLPAPEAGTPIRYTNIVGHELRFGIRYSLW